MEAILVKKRLSFCLAPSDRLIISKFKPLDYPRDKVIICFFSGGKGSLVAAWWLKVNGYTNVKLLFTDTKSEDPDLYRFIYECQKYLGYDMIKLTEGRDIWEVFKDVKFMGNTRIDPCSRILKREITQKFIKKYKLTSDKFMFCFGIGLFEEDRLKPLAKNYPFEVRSPLVDSYLDDTLIFNHFLERFNIKLPHLYSIGLSHNNCGGFCVKAGLHHYRTLYTNDRERYLYFEKKEEEVYTQIPNARPFLRKTVKGKLTYITLKEYRLKYLEAGKDLENEESKQSCITCSVI